MLRRKRTSGATRLLLFCNLGQKPFTNNLLPAVRGFEGLTEMRLIEPMRYPGFGSTGGASPAPVPAAAIEDGLKDFEPDLIVCLGGGLFLPNGVVEAVPPGTVTIGIALSDPYGLQASLEIAPRFDLFYTQDPQTIPEYERHGIAALRCDIAIDPSLLSPGKAEPSCDILYFGKWTPYRDAIVTRLARSFDVRVHTYSNEKRWTVPISPPLEDMDAISAALRGTHLALELAMLDDAPEPYAGTFRITYRPFFAAACGVPTLIERFASLAEFFEPDEEIAVFDSVEDVDRAAGAVLAADERRRQMGERARLRVLRDHTWTQRAAAILTDASTLRRAKQG